MTVYLKDWPGYVGDGIADDTEAFQAAVDYAAPLYETLVIPDGTTRITSKISHTQHMEIVAETRGIWEDPAVNYVRKGAVIVSEVENDYALAFGPPPQNYTIGGTYRGFKLMGIGAGKTTGKGMLLQNGGWDAKIEDVTIQDFAKGGLTSAYMQDMHAVGLSIIGCGTAGESASLTLTHSGPGTTANLLCFDRLRLEKTPYMLRMTPGSIGITFNNGHFEAGEYEPAAWLGDVNRFTPYHTIYAENVQNVHFNDCVITPNSVEGAASVFGISQDAVQPAVYVSGRGNRFNGCSFLRYGTGMTMRALIIPTGSSDNEVTGCFFETLNTDKYGIIINGTEFHHNRVTMEASGNGKLYGLWSSNSSLDDNTFGCENGSDPAKTEGAVFKAEGPVSYMGWNKVNIAKLHTLKSSGWTAKAAL